MRDEPQRTSAGRLATTRTWVVLLIGWKSASSSQKHYSDLGSGTSSVWNFSARSQTSFRT